MKKRGLCINDAQDRNSGDDATGEWSTPVNWEEDLNIKAELRRKFCFIFYPSVTRERRWRNILDESAPA